MTSRRAVIWSVLMLALVLRNGGFAQGTPGHVTGSGVVSPSVVATAIVEFPSPERARLLLLVLWRGAPGWMSKSGATGSGGSSRGSGRPADDLPLFHEIRYGDVTLTLSFRPLARTLTIDGNAVALGPDDNVVLVDRVDGAAGPSILRTLHIDPDAVPIATQGPSAMPIVRTQDFIRRSPDLVDFLRCNLPMPDPNGAVQQVMKMLCQY